jgi:hypothetical protein
MHQADQDAGLVLARLQDRFYLPTMPLPPTPAASGVLVGFEVEVPWRAYFPALRKKYFAGEHRTYESLPKDEQEALSADCSAEEATFLPRLRATQECGIRRGKDPYWEFVLPPVSDLATDEQILLGLRAAMLVPRGVYSLHATVSGIPSRQDALLMLLLLELLFGRKERILQGCRGLGAWARKGDGGVVTKTDGLLYGSELAYELRTLELPADRAAQTVLLRAIAHATQCFAQEAKSHAARQKVKGMLVAHGLPFKAWGSPRSSPEVWQTYVERYDDLRAAAQGVGRDLGLVA